MECVKILSHERRRDGGTTYIKTPYGTLFVPTPFNKDRVIKFKGETFFEFDWPIEEKENAAYLRGWPTM